MGCTSSTTRGNNFHGLGTPDATPCHGEPDTRPKPRPAPETKSDKELALDKLVNILNSAYQKPVKSYSLKNQLLIAKELLALKQDHGATEEELIACIAKVHPHESCQHVGDDLACWIKEPCELELGIRRLEEIIESDIVEDLREEREKEYEEADAANAYSPLYPGRG